MVTDNITDILRKCDVFCELSDKELRTIAKLAKVEKFSAGETIYSQGSIGTKLYILSEGQVSLERTMDIGGKRKATVPVFIQTESPTRRLLGSWSALAGEEHRHMCTARCYRPTTVVSLPCSKLKEIVAKDPKLRMKILEQLILLLRDRIDSSYEAMEAL